MIRRVLKTVVLSLLPLVVLLGAAELLLWGVGVGTPAAELSLSRGFDHSAAYLVPHDRVAGAWRTQMFEDPSQEVEIPPRDGRRRLILFGGSNTQGFPEGVLQSVLMEADPSPGWEVVNLGRAGYGSERVTILLEQALVALRPDVVLIYAGHNEFMEGAFLDELEEQGVFGWTGRMTKAFSRLRTTTALTRLLRPAELTVEDRRPEPKQIGRDAEFRQFTEADTQRFYGAYADNLRRMCTLAATRGVAVVLCTLVGNDFEPPLVPRHPADVPPDRVKVYARAERQAIEKLPERYREMVRRMPRLRPEDWGMNLYAAQLEERAADPATAGRQAPPLRALSGPLAEAAARPRPGGVPGAFWSDPAYWSGHAFEVLGFMSAFYARDLSDEERATVRQVRDELVAALEISPRYSLGHHRLGLMEYLLGDTDAASRELALAFVYDRAPRRANDVSNGAVRALAEDLENEVVFLDVEALFRARSPEGLFSYELMTDVCHLQSGVRPLLMEDFAPAVLRAHRDLQRE